MAHPVTSPAIQRAQRMLDQRVLPQVLGNTLQFEVQATPEHFEPITLADAQKLPLAGFTIGTKWGRAWHSRWFRFTAVVPEQLHGAPLVASFDLGFNGRGDGFQVEGLAWRNGRILHAIQPDRRLVHLGNGVSGEIIEIWLDAAATPVIAGHVHGFGPTALGDPETAPHAPLYTLRAAQLATFRQQVNDLAVAMRMCIDLAIDLPPSAQRERIFAALEHADQSFDVNNVVGSAGDALKCLTPVLNSGNGPSAHRIVATGHAHLDTAWLWPLRETRRKALRTFANAVNLLRRNPDMVYCHSQAQHYAWVAEDAPELFAEITELVREGRWEPVGGMWVEADLNLPSGESLLRQMVQGQRAFRGWFGITCDGAFLPDDFGYPGSLPQIAHHGGAHWFFTQKLSWNETNSFPHHTFWWEGIDGTRLFTHFSPIDTYNALLTPGQLRFAERNFKDHRGASSSLALYGHGDGGGGPTQAMVDMGRLSADLEGVPRVRFGRVDDFFANAEEEYGAAAPAWVGEMYFEKHRGTYSTQIGTKQGNRNSERALHELELWSAAAGVRPDEIDTLWQRVLTQQFHDIIPGSSIAWVHQDAEQTHTDVVDQCEQLIGNIINVAASDETWIMNPAPVALDGVRLINGNPMWINAPAFGSVKVNTPTTEDEQVMVEQHLDGSITIDNGIVAITINTDGTISHCVGGRELRDIITPGSFGGFTIHQDTPAEYDAWDIDRADANRPSTWITSTHAPTITRQHPLSATVRVDYQHGPSRFQVDITVHARSSRIDIAMKADWNGSEQRVQFVLPTDVHSREAVCGTQFGHVRRGRHGNTGWDIARFEVCAHRYVAISEPRFSVGILADGPRGYDIRDDALKLTLLRAPHFPDPNADIGEQRISWSIWFGDGDPLLHGIETESALIAHPARLVQGTPRITSAGVDLHADGCLISSIKPADDDSGDIIVRAWETTGARTTGVLTSTNRNFNHAWSCNALEEQLPGSTALNSAGAGSWEVELRPFQICTWRLSR